MKIPFCGPTYSGRSVNIDATRSINFYPEVTGTQDNKTQLAMVGCPGTMSFASGIGTAPVRGLYPIGTLLYAVIDNFLYTIDTSGNLSTPKGTLSTSTGRVMIKYNGSAQSGVGGDQLMITDGAAGYIYNTSTGAFSTIASAGGWADLLASSHYPTHFTYLDGYFIAINGSMSFWVSDLYDGTTWSALATSPIAATPDNIIGIAAHRQQLFLFKQHSTEVWYDAGIPTTIGSPFLRVSGAVFDYGCISRWTIASAGASLFFLATQRMGNSGEVIGVAEVTEYQPKIVSTPAINYKIAQSTNFTDCFAYCYSDEGHTFYVLTNPTDDWTIVYDTSTQMWHERSSFNATNASVKRHVSNCYAYFNNKHYIGDYRSSSIYEMDTSYFTDNGNRIVSVRTAQTIYEDTELNNVFVTMLAVDMETGVGSSVAIVTATTPYPAGDDHTANSRPTVTDTVISATATGFATTTATPANKFTGMDTNTKVLVSGFATPSINTSYTVESLAVDTLSIHTTVHPPATEAAGPSVTIYTYKDVLIPADGSITAGAIATGVTDPQAYLSWSNDGGHTWSAEYPTSMGINASYSTRVRWRRLGYSPNRVFRLTISDPIKRNIIGAYVEAGT